MVDAPPSLASYGCAFLAQQRQREGAGDVTEATFATELALLHLMPETPADAVALALIGLNVIDRNEGCEGNDVTERETVAAMRAIRRSVRVLAGAAGVDVTATMGGFYLNECRAAVLEPEEAARVMAEARARCRVGRMVQS